MLMSLILQSDHPKTTTTKHTRGEEESAGRVEGTEMSVRDL